MRTIRVTGKGQIKVRPDMTVITMDLEGMYPNYDETLRHSSEDTEVLKTVLEQFGFERTDLKTLNFDVDTKYESYEERHMGRKEYKRRLVGYKFTHSLKVEFASDNDRLGKILYALANCSVRPELRISYTVKDQEAAKNEMLAKAIADAKGKAAVLANAAGVALRDIQSIDYSWGEISFECRPMNRYLECADACMYDGAAPKGYAMDIEPDDIDVSDTVTVIWEIE